ncbi:MAG: hypothetical protein OQK09_14345 [Colwellia sp.]|nr:hypothetical protein [Colwellia sp.]MCW9082687.1 hypothetical protein [Colwellia sp.]
MSKFFISIVIGGLAIVLSMSLFNNETPVKRAAENKNHTPEKQKRVVKTDTDNVGIIKNSNEKLVSEQERSVDTLQAKKQASQNKTAEHLQLALARVPDSYHSIFQWSQEVDEEMVNEYALAASNQEQQLADINLEQQLSDFIFQHELSTQVDIEVLRCTASSCEVYGKELSSNAWGVIIEDAKQASWWSFSNDATRNGMSTTGEMVFLTIIRD